MRTQKRLKAFAIVVALALTNALAGCSTDGVSRMFSNDYDGRVDAGYQMPTISINKVLR